MNPPRWALHSPSPRRTSSWMVGSSRLLRAACLLAAVGCTRSSEVRRVTYPPDFHYIEREAIRSTMRGMALDVVALDELLRVEPPAEPDRLRVVELLTSLELKTKQLAESGPPANHPLIRDHLDELRRDLALARQAASREPPNYFLAGSITGSCLYCHDHTAAAAESAPAAAPLP